MLFIILALFILGIYFYFKCFKKPVISSLTMITGGVKTGKTLLSVSSVKREYTKARIKYYVKKCYYKMFKKNKLKDLEEPLIYTNIPLNDKIFKHQCLLSDSLILRLHRFNYGSIIFIDEASLVADSMAIRDESVNEKIKEFFKLIAHETRGGKVIINSQSLLDVHYNIKRSVSNYIYIVKDIKLLFHHILVYKYLTFQDDVVNVSTGNVDKTEETYRCFISKSSYKYYDRYCYSVLTDSLPKDNHEIKSWGNSLKIGKIFSFNKLFKKGKMLEVKEDVKSIDSNINH